MNTVPDYTVNKFFGQEIVEVTNTCPVDTSMEDLRYELITLFKSVSRQRYSICLNMEYKLVFLKMTRREADEELKRFRLRNLMFLLLLNVQ